MVNIAVGTVPTRYNPEAPLLVIDFVDGNGVAIRGYTFTKTLVRSLGHAVHLDEIVFVRNGLIEISDVDYTWVKCPVAIKFVPKTEFVVGRADEAFPRLDWNVRSVGDVELKIETGEVIGKKQMHSLLIVLLIDFSFFRCKGLCFQEYCS